ncbi:MAG: beta-propeller domain-containing protein, partial [Acidobacteriota bacterium]|nr:beta-propeller domain-containing protein [Acidobacteriota bacterium]
MNTSALRLFAATLAIMTAIACGQVSFGKRAALHLDGGDQPKKTLKPFRSEQELAAYFKQLAEEQKRLARRRGALGGASMNADVAGAPVAQPAVAAKSEADSKDKSADESITNTQHAGVDEGGIVKLHGDHLVVLRRGRLFTVAVGDGQLKPVSAVDAYAPDLDPSGTWYDEMLVSDDTVVVIGYSYQRGGTEIGLFDIDRAGRLAYRATYHLRSNDYYSSRNYSSRLVGDKLIFYTPLSLSLWDADPTANFPALRKWHKGATNSEWQRIAPATRVYRAEKLPRSPYSLALHTVTVCSLSARPDMTCDATAVVGPLGSVFYVSPQSVYVWASQWVNGEDKASRRSVLYRLPLDGSAPSALNTSGSPVDQFSFLEGEDGYLNVLVR